jgi:hypothetical protein
MLAGTKFGQALTYHDPAPDYHLDMKLRLSESSFVVCEMRCCVTLRGRRDRRSAASLRFWRRPLLPPYLMGFMIFNNMVAEPAGHTSPHDISQSCLSA